MPSLSINQRSVILPFIDKYDKQNNTWLLVDTELFFSCSTRWLTSERSEGVSYRVEQTKRNCISTHAHVLSFSTHSRFVPNHFVTSPYPNSADSHPVWVGSNPKHPMLNIYAYGIFAWVGDVSEIERVRFLIQTIKCGNAVQVPSPRSNLFISYILRCSLFCCCFISLLFSNEFTSHSNKSEYAAFTCKNVALNAWKLAQVALQNFKRALFMIKTITLIIFQKKAVSGKVFHWSCGLPSSSDDSRIRLIRW